MRRFLLIIGLEGYALSLAFLHAYAGVRTDEAKYLLDIPYPHPPLARWLFSQFEFLPMQEMLLRILIANLVVFAVFLIADMLRDRTREQCVTLCGLYLLSLPVLTQAGTVMMAPLTAVQAVALLWLYRRGSARHAGGVMLLWLASLFTAYQAILFVPLLIGYTRRVRLGVWPMLLGIGGPVVLLGIYTLGNPLAMASMVNAGGQNASLGIGGSLARMLGLWLTAGSLVLSVLGVAGMGRSRDWYVLAAFALVALYVLVSFRAYYAILFLPLLVVGAADSALLRRSPAYVLALHLIATVWMLSFQSPDFHRSPARFVMARLQPTLQQGPVLIAGSFGHDWQYESRVPILRYSESVLPAAEAVVCLSTCPDLTDMGFVRFPNVPVEVWVRSHTP